ncbi:MAG: hypothetical protein KDA75_13090 [Planctomycetaceae bacterium]|nr:hypothetical protein [Planctomycetaceae bacterium]
MRAAVVALTVLFIGADTADLEYEVQLRKDFEEFQEKAEALAADKGVTSPDRLIPVLMNRRSLWINGAGTGFFERLNSGHWIEKVPDGVPNLFLESSRTEAYVALGRVDRTKTRVRLYDAKCDVMLNGKGEFKTFYKGSWER